MLSCEQYDYIEIVCMHHYPIQVIMKSGDIIEGTAEDTLIQKNHNPLTLSINKEECLKLSGLNEDDYKIIALNEIASIQVLEENPHFVSISFIDM